MKSWEELKWEELKKKGSAHYKTGKFEPIDLIRDLGLLDAFARANIIKYASRLKGVDDCDKIIHYAELLKASMGGTDCS